MEIDLSYSTNKSNEQAKMINTTQTKHPPYLSKINTTSFYIKTPKPPIIVLPVHTKRLNKYFLILRPACLHRSNLYSVFIRKISTQ